MGTMAVTVMMLLRKIMTPDRHANLVLHVRMKGAILGSVDLAMQVSTIILVHTTRSVIGQEVMRIMMLLRIIMTPCRQAIQVLTIILINTTSSVQGQKVKTDFYFRKREDPPCSRSPQVPSRCSQASSFPME